MLIAMAGLPGTGKSTLAAALAAQLAGVVLDKDRVREALFPSIVRDYSTGQDDLCMDAIYRATEAILQANSDRVVIVDGRTFLRYRQLDPLIGLAGRLGERLHIIECVCDDDVARERLAADQGRHPAGNRTFELYRSLMGSAVPISLPKCVVDTGRMSVDESVRVCIAYLRGE